MISLVGLLAVIVTLRGNAVAIDEARIQLRAQLFAESESHFVALEQALASVPTALRFHGIEVTELESVGISPKSSDTSWRISPLVGSILERYKTLKRMCFVKVNTIV